MRIPKSEDLPVLLLSWVTRDGCMNIRFICVAQIYPGQFFLPHYPAILPIIFRCTGSSQQALADMVYRIIRKKRIIKWKTKKQTPQKLFSPWQR